MEKSFFTVGIGASAGGIPALIDFFEHIPSSIGVAFIVVTHLIRDRRSLLNHILSRHTSLPLIRVEKKTLLEAGKIYLIIENTTLKVIDGYLIVSIRDTELVNWSVNILFESLANDFKEKAIGIVLSGAGDDGLKGAKKIEQMGGTVMAQDPDTAEVNGMPSSITSGNHPIAILKPAALVQHLNHLCMDV